MSNPSAKTYADFQLCLSFLDETKYFDRRFTLDKSKPVFYVVSDSSHGGTELPGRTSYRSGFTQMRVIPLRSERGGKRGVAAYNAYTKLDDSKASAV